MYSKFFYSFLCVIFFNWCSAQSFRYTQYTTHNGLPIDNVYAAAQDDNGYMWFATDFGIAKFDGYRFINYNRNNGIQAKAITDIVYAGGDSCIFLSYPGFIQSINGKGQVHTIANVKDITLHQLVRFKNMFVYYERKKNKFGLLQQGRIETVALEKFTGSTAVVTNAITAFGDSAIAVSTDKGLFIKNGNTVNQYFNGGNVAYAILKNNGTVAAVVNDVYVQLELSTGLQSNQQSIPGKEPIYNMHEDAEGNVWLRGMSKGVFRCSNSGIEEMAALLGLQSKAVNKFYKDAANNLWLCTDGAGVILKGNNSIISYNAQSGLASSKVTKLLGSGSNLIIGTGNGISIKNETGLHPLPLPRGKKVLQYTHHLFNYPGSSFGINIAGTYDSDTGTLQQPFIFKQLQQYKIAYTEKQAVYVQGNDSTWVADKFSLQLLVKGLVTQTYSLKQLNLRKIYCITSYSNSLFIGTADGLLQFNNGSFKKTDTVLTKRLGEVFEILLLNNKLHMATDIGLLIYNNKTYSFAPAATTYGGNYCRSITADDEDKIWGATWDGIFVTDGNSRINYGTANGLTSKTCNTILYNKTDGKIYVGTDNGLSVIDKTKLATPVFNSRLSITSYLQDTVLLPGGASLKSHQNNLRFYLNLPVYGAGEEIMYEYKIDNGKWQTTASPYITVTDIAGGKHTITAQAKLNGIVITSSQNSFAFTVQQKFYKTWWFWLLLLGALQFLIFKLINRYNKNKRLKQLQAQKQQSEVASLKQQAFTSLMNPHFIFNALNSIQFYINKQDRQTANKYLSDFATLVRRSFDAAQKPFVTLDEELETIRLYLQLEKMRFTDKFDYNIALNNTAEEEEWLLPGMVLQPFLENAILHGLAPLNSHGQLNINIEGAGNTLYITITDNGIGLQKSKQLHTAKKHNSRGMQLIKERLEILSNKAARPVQLHITELNPAAENPGTKIELVVPQEVYSN